MESPDLDAQGKLERKALGNVRRLYEKLGYKDKLDGENERKFIVVAGVIVASVLSLLALAAFLEPYKVDNLAVDRTLCIQEAVADSAMARRKELREKFPEMRVTELNKLLEQHFRSAEPGARARCELKFPQPA